MTADQPPRPANIANIVAINEGKRPLTMHRPTAPGLTASRAKELIDESHLVLDCRKAGPFGESHIANAFNIAATSGEFEQRIGWVTPIDESMVLVLREDGDLDRVLHKMAFLGLDNRVKGFLAGGIEAWNEAGFPTVSLSQITADDLNYRISSGSMRVLDVREPSEWNESHIDGAENMSFKILSENLESLILTKDDPVTVTCAGGVRSSTACSILLKHGYTGIHNLVGGMKAWKAAGLPTVR